MDITGDGYIDIEILGSIIGFYGDWGKGSSDNPIDLIIMHKSELIHLYILALLMRNAIAHF